MSTTIIVSVNDNWDALLL